MPHGFPGASGKGRTACPIWALRWTDPPHRRLGSLVRSPPLRVHGAGALWGPTPRRRPRLASGQETAVRWVMIIEIWYKATESALPRAYQRTETNWLLANDCSADSPLDVSTGLGGGGSPGQAARGYEPAVPSMNPLSRRRHEPVIYYYGEHKGPSARQFDALSIAFEIAEPSVPAATANPAAIMASNSAYSAAAAPFSSRRKRARKAPDFIILDLP